MLGVLAIIGVLSVGGIAGYSKAMAKHNINKAIDQISMIIANVQTLFGNASNRNYMALQKSYELGVFPGDMKQRDEDSAYNVFGLDATVSSDMRGIWWINYSIPSQDVCVALLTQNWGSGNDGFDELIVGRDDDFTFKKTPVSIPEAGAVCKQLGEMYDYVGDDVYISLGFK